MVCVESNPDYVAVGRRVLPEAEWICGDLFDLPDMDLGEFDTALANPPFGHTVRTGHGPRYRGRGFEYHVLDVAAVLARRGVFLLPQQSAPFTYSGRRGIEWTRDAEYDRFVAATGIELSPGCGLDTTLFDNDWRGVRPLVEIVTCDFTELTTAAQPQGATPAAAVGVAQQLDVLAE